MYRPSFRSIWTILAIAIFAITALYVVEGNKVYRQNDWYREKMEAAKLMQTAMETLREERLSQKGLMLDSVNDPNQTGLIGEQYSLITTDRGALDIKQSLLNPNFAAVCVEMFKELGCQKNDLVAISFTGSMPGANLAILSAVHVLELHPVIISSVGASEWGANDPYFTWLDMEATLAERGLWPYRSVAASLGGGKDIGVGLSPKGRSLLEQAIERNKAELIYKEPLYESIDKRMEIYQKIAGGQSYSAFVNVGGGVAVLGNSINGKLIPPGAHRRIKAQNFLREGVIIKFAKNGIPLIHILNVRTILNKYELPIAPYPLPQIGEGPIFVQERYNLILTGIALILLCLIIYGVIRLDNRFHHFPDAGFDPEELF